jgi:hypothetical protein
VLFKVKDWAAWQLLIPPTGQLLVLLSGDAPVLSIKTAACAGEKKIKKLAKVKTQALTMSGKRR